MINNVKFTEEGLDYAPESVLDTAGGSTDEEPDDIEENATPLGEIDAVTHAGEYISVTVDVEMDMESSGLSDSARPVVKAQASDESGDAVLVTWDEHSDASNPAEPLSPWPEIEVDEPSSVYLQRVRVDEYDGQLQLVLERGKTQAERIQHGVGYTTQPAPEDADQVGLGTAADGGSTAETVESDEGPPEDAEGLKADAKRLASLLRDYPDGLKEPDLLGKVRERHDISPKRGEKALRKAIEEGLIMEQSGELFPA